MTTLYKVSTISEQILRFITRISELNDKIHEGKKRKNNSNDKESKIEKKIRKLQSD